MARRLISAPCVNSSKPAKPNEFPSGSSNLVKIPPHCGLHGGDSKTHPTAAPFFILGLNIFGDEIDARVAANEFRDRISLGLDEREVCTPVGRSDLDPAETADALIHNQTEAELVHVEAQASLLVANEDHDEVEGKVGILFIQGERKAVHAKRQERIFRVPHAGDYMSETCHPEKRLDKLRHAGESDWGRACGR